VKIEWCIIMLNKIVINTSKIIKYSKIYFFVTSVVFLIIPIDMMPQITERFQMLIFVLICYYTFYYILWINLVKNISSKKYTFNNVKKIEGLKLSLFTYLGIAGLIVNILLALSNSKNITLHLLLANISLALINGALKNKDIYDDSYNKKYAKK